jgi:methylated-DNA-protein-cysteine methyltransferase-like protein
MKAWRNYDGIYAVVMAIPRGKVATYGQIAELAGLPGRARQVGKALRFLPEDSAVPWHRVVNARGGISARGSRVGEREQRLLLEEEGITFDRNHRLSLAEHRWVE